MSRGDVPVEEALVDMREHAERGGVHHGVEMARQPAARAQRFGAADFGERAHAVGIAAHQRDLRPASESAQAAPRAAPPLPTISTDDFGRRRRVARAGR